MISRSVHSDVTACLNEVSRRLDGLTAWQSGATGEPTEVIRVPQRAVGVPQRSVGAPQRSFCRSLPCIEAPQRSARASVSSVSAAASSCGSTLSSDERSVRCGEPTAPSGESAASSVSSILSSVEASQASGGTAPRSADAPGDLARRHCDLARGHRDVASGHCDVARHLEHATRDPGHLARHRREVGASPARLPVELRRLTLRPLGAAEPFDLPARATRHLVGRTPRVLGRRAVRGPYRVAGRSPRIAAYHFSTTLQGLFVDSAAAGLADQRSVFPIVLY